MNTHQLVPCPACGVGLRIKAKYRGQSIRCRHCQTVVRVSESVRIDCPDCRAELKINPSLLGRSIVCQHCQSTVLAPTEGRPGLKQVAPGMPTGIASGSPSDPPSPRECPHCQEARDEADRLRKSLDQAVADRRALVGRLDVQAGQLEELDALRQALQDAMRSESVATGRVSELTGRIEHLEEERERWESACREANDDRTNVRAELAAMGSRLEASARLLRDAHGRWATDRRRWRAEAEAILAQARADRERSRAESSEAVARATAIESGRRDAEDRVARLSELIETLRRDRAESESEERDQLRGQLEELRAERDRLADDRDRLISERDSADHLRDEPGPGPDPFEEKYREAIGQAEAAARDRDALSRQFNLFAQERQEAEYSLLASLDRLSRELEAGRIERSRFESTVQYFNALAQEAAADRDRVQAALLETSTRLEGEIRERRALEQRLASLTSPGEAGGATGATGPPPQALESKPSSEDPGPGAGPAPRGPSAAPGIRDRDGCIDLALAHWDGVDPT